MRALSVSRRRFLTGTGALVGVELAGESLQFPFSTFSLGSQDQTRVDYTLHIKNAPDRDRAQTNSLCDYIQWAVSRTAASFQRRTAR